MGEVPAVFSFASLPNSRHTVKTLCKSIQNVGKLFNPKIRASETLCKSAAAVCAATFLAVGSFFLLSLDLRFSEILIIAMPLILHDAVRGEGNLTASVLEKDCIHV